MDVRDIPIFLAALFLAVILPCSTALSGAPAGADDVVARLQARYASIASVRAGFTQETMSAAFGTTETSRGTVAFKKPGRMRWSYAVPSGDEIVSDGETFRLFQADLNQVVERPAASVNSTIATDFLTGVGEIGREFTVTVEPPAEGAGTRTHTLRLVPVNEMPNIQSVTLVVSSEDFIILSTTTEDLFGNRTKVTFTSVEVNPDIDDRYFDFTAPEGAVVIAQ